MKERFADKSKKIIKNFLKTGIIKSNHQPSFTNAKSNSMDSLSREEKLYDRKKRLKMQADMTDEKLPYDIGIYLTEEEYYRLIDNNELTEIDVPVELSLDEKAYFYCSAQQIAEIQISGDIIITDKRFWFLNLSDTLKINISDIISIRFFDNIIKITCKYQEYDFMVNRIDVVKKALNSIYLESNVSLEIQQNASQNNNLMNEAETSIKDYIKENIINDPNSDPLIFEAIDIVYDAGQVSTSYIQRRLKVGYARAARIIDELEERGIIEPQEGSRPRNILITKQQLMANISRFKQENNIQRETVNQIQAIDNMEGHQFEFLCAELLQKNGFENIEVTPGSGDQGVDILAQKEGVKYAFQCKRFNSPLGNKPVQEVNAGKMYYNCHVGVVLTNSTFTPSAEELANATGVLLWGREKLISLMKI